jgi:DNA-directed RNA polymerase specialized sigma24 family protein
VSTPLPPRADRISWADLSVQSTAILRQVIVPIHLEGSTATETAKRLGIPIASIRLLVAHFANEVSELGRQEWQRADLDVPDRRCL